MKKLLSFILVCVFLVTVATGCSGSNDEPAANQNKEETTQPSEENKAAAEKQQQVMDSSVETSDVKVPKQIKTDPSDITIAFSLYSASSPYFGVMMDTIKSECEAKGIKFVGLQANDNLQKQIADIEDIIAQDVDVLILNPKDPKALMPSTDKAMKAGIPVIIIDNPMDPAANYTTLVTSDNFTIGQLVGEWTAANKFSNKDAKMAIISGQKGSLASDLRRTGFITGFTEETLRQKAGYTLNVVTQAFGGWGTPGGQTAMEDILVAFPDINLLVAENDAMAIGALQAIQEAGKEDQIEVVACADGQKEAFQLIKEGKYGATGLNSPTIASKTAVEVALKVMAGEQVKQTVYTPAVAITEENVDEWYDPNAKF